MFGEAHVKDIEALRMACMELTEIQGRIDEQCNKARHQAKEVLSDTQMELANSERLLVEAFEEENRCLMEVKRCKKRVAEAQSGLPYTIVEYTYALEQLTEATIKYEKAVLHREKMQHRVELARQCVCLADEMSDTMHSKFQYSQDEIQHNLERGRYRLQEAEDILSQYHMENLHGDNKKGDMKKVDEKMMDDSKWICIGPLETADLTPYNHCVGLYRHEVDGVVKYVGRAIELNNGGFRKRLSDYRRPSDSARKHTSGQIIHENLKKITTYILIVGDDQIAIERTKKLEKEYIKKYNYPEWNKQLN